MVEPPPPPPPPPPSSGKCEPRPRCGAGDHSQGLVRARHPDAHDGRVHVSLEQQGCMPGTRLPLRVRSKLAPLHLRGLPLPAEALGSGGEPTSGPHECPARRGRILSLSSLPRLLPLSRPAAASRPPPSKRRERLQSCRQRGRATWGLLSRPPSEGAPRDLSPPSHRRQRPTLNRSK